MNVGSRIYYDLSTGEVILNTGDRSGAVVETTIEQDFNSYLVLSLRNPSTVGVIQLEYGQYSQDISAGGIIDRVDVTTKQVFFRYPDVTGPSDPEPERPLSEVVYEIKSQNAEIIFALVSNNLM